MTKLQILVSPEPHRSFRREFNDPEIVIGRDASCGLTIARPGVSGVHAKLVIDQAGQVTVVDMGSTNGIFVNGVRASKQLLAMGDRIELGDNGPAVQIVAVIPDERRASTTESPSAVLPSRNPFDASGAESFGDNAKDKKPPDRRPPLPPRQELKTTADNPSSTRVLVNKLAVQNQRWKWMSVGVFALMAVVAGLIALFWTGRANTDFAQTVFEDYVDSVFLVRTYDENSVATATCFAIDENGVFATNAHVTQGINELIERGGKAEIVSSTGKKRYQINRAVTHADWREDSSKWYPDVGLLFADLPDGEKVKRVRFPSREQLHELVDQQGVRLCYIGFPSYQSGDYLEDDQIKPVVNNGNLVRCWTYERKSGNADNEVMMEHNMKCWKGASGSPVFDSTGCVVGIIANFKPPQIEDEMDVLTYGTKMTFQAVRFDVLLELNEKRQTAESGD